MEGAENPGGVHGEDSSSAEALTLEQVRLLEGPGGASGWRGGGGSESRVGLEHGGLCELGTASGGAFRGKGQPGRGM